LAGSIQETDEQDDDEEEEIPDYDNLHGDDSSDDEVEYTDQQRSLLAKVSRNDSLAKLLNSRPHGGRGSVSDHHDVIPHRTEEQKNEIRQKIGSHLNRRLSQRPTARELEEKHILLRQTPEELRRDREEIKRTLIRKLSFRPTVGELKERRIIKFNDYVEVTDAEDFDRKGDKPWMRLTPKDKAAIRKELNEFKSTEMAVHEESRHFTRFHQP
jgi:phosphatase and actin regulator